MPGKLAEIRTSGNENNSCRVRGEGGSMPLFDAATAFPAAPNPAPTPEFKHPITMPRHLTSMHGHRTPDTGHRTLDIGHRTLDLGPWTLDLGPWTLDLGPWTLDIGHWTLDIGYWILDRGQGTGDSDRRWLASAAANLLRRSSGWPSRRAPSLLTPARARAMTEMKRGSESQFHKSSIHSPLPSPELQHYKPQSVRMNSNQ